MKTPHASAREILLVAGGALLCLGGVVTAMRFARPETAPAVPPSPTVLAPSARADDLPLKERLNEILRAEDHDDRLEALAGNLTAEEIAAGLVLADQIEDRRDRARFLRGLFKRWTLLDPQAALAAARALPEREARGALYSVYEVWAMQDLDAAKAAALALPEGGERTADRALRRRAGPGRGGSARGARFHRCSTGRKGSLSRSRLHLAPVGCERSACGAGSGARD